MKIILKTDAEEVDGKYELWVRIYEYVENFEITEETPYIIKINKDVLKQHFHLFQTILNDNENLDNEQIDLNSIDSQSFKLLLQYSNIVGNKEKFIIEQFTNRVFDNGNYHIDAQKYISYENWFDTTIKHIIKLIGAAMYLLYDDGIQGLFREFNWLILPDNQISENLDINDADNLFHGEFNWDDPTYYEYYTLNKHVDTANLFIKYHVNEEIIAKLYLDVFDNTTKYKQYFYYLHVALQYYTLLNTSMFGNVMFTTEIQNLKTKIHNYDYFFNKIVQDNQWDDDVEEINNATDVDINSERDFLIFIKICKGITGRDLRFEFDMFTKVQKYRDVDVLTKTFEFTLDLPHLSNYTLLKVCARYENVVMLNKFLSVLEQYRNQKTPIEWCLMVMETLDIATLWNRLSSKTIETLFSSWIAKGYKVVMLKSKMTMNVTNVNDIDNDEIVQRQVNLKVGLENNVYMGFSDEGVAALQVKEEIIKCIDNYFRSICSTLMPRPRCDIQLKQDNIKLKF